MDQRAVSDWMTPSPYIVSPHDKLVFASQLMKEHEIRHLPVMEDGKLVGLLSDRDLNLVQSLAPVPYDEITVEDAMTGDPYSVSPELPVQAVARTMAKRKIGSAVVIDHGAVTGVFTITDALSFLADILEGKDSRVSYDDVATTPVMRRRRREPDL